MNRRFPLLLSGFLLLAAAARPAPPLLPPPPDDPFAVPKKTFPTLRLPHIPLVTLPETTGMGFDLLPPESPVLDAARAAGFRWARVTLPWRDVEKERGVRDFTAYARFAAELRRKNLEPIFVLTLSHPLVEEGRPPVTSAGIDALAGYAGAGAAALSKTVRYWQIGADLSTPDGGQAANRAASGTAESDPNPVSVAGGSVQPVSSGAAPAHAAIRAETYAAIARAAAGAIRRANPKAMILSGGLPGGDMTFARAAFGHGLRETIDGLAIHPAGSGFPDSWTETLRQLDRVVEGGAGSAKLPVWVTGVSSVVGDGEEGARRLVRLMLGNFGRNIAATIWSPERINDPPAPGSSSSMAAHPRYRAVEFMNRHLAGLKLLRLRELPGPLRGLVFGSRRREVNVLWCEKGEAPLTVRPHSATREGLVLHDLYGQEGETRVVRPETILKLTESPVYIEGRIDVTGLP